MPIPLSLDGEPEPDFALVINRDGDYATLHPTLIDILLGIEVTDFSLDYQRSVKLPLYAEAEMWQY